MTLSTAILWAAAGLLLSLLASTVAWSLRLFSRTELELHCQRREREPMFREIVGGQAQATVTADCLTVLADGVFLAALAACITSRPAEEGFDWREFMIVAFAGGLALVVVNVWIPAALARLWSVPFLCATWYVWRSVVRLFTPLEWGARQVNAILYRLAGKNHAEPAEPSLDEDLRNIVSEQTREGVLEEDAREMIEGVIQLGDAEVSQIMTPRTYMLSIHVALSFDEAVKFIITSAHSRVPVYDKNRDDIVGILHMKDMLPELLKPESVRATTISGLLRPAQFVPESKRLDELLEEFQKTRNHMAVVLDEYGGVSGLVTIEDVLEEIVGEIEDEYDEMLDGIKNIDERTADVLARVPIEEVNQRLGVRLPEEGEFDTIGGLVFSHLGHIPTAGESVTVADVRMTVLDVTRRRIERVRLEVLDPSERELA